MNMYDIIAHEKLRTRIEELEFFHKRCEKELHIKFEKIDNRGDTLFKRFAGDIHETNRSIDRLIEINNSLMARIEVLEDHINDASVDRARITKLEEKTSEKYTHPLIFDRIDRLEIHKNRQIDENRKISARVDELENKKEEVFTSEIQRDVTHLLNRVHDLEKIYYKLDEVRKIQSAFPEQSQYKCLLCHGTGRIWA